ncbi:MAG: GFA family protein [Pseudomonadota bacterium]
MYLSIAFKPLKLKKMTAQIKHVSGRCFCGSVAWHTKPPILWAAFCHCGDCRKAASSDYVSWFGVDKNTLNWHGPRQIYKSSKHVTRSFCKKCGAPMSFETNLLPDETHLYAVTLDDLAHYKPTAHLFWSERLAWIQINDHLPKHPKGLQNEICHTNKHLLNDRK